VGKQPRQSNVGDVLYVLNGGGGNLVGDGLDVVEPLARVGGGVGVGISTRRAGLFMLTNTDADAAA
jgi:hypothetical protein